MINTDIAKAIFETKYLTEMIESEYIESLERGIQLLSQNTNTDKLFIHRFYRGEDLKFVKMALEYNEELMVRLLMD